MGLTLSKFALCRLTDSGLSADSEESVKLDLDDQGGRKFLRVLLNLVMHDYPLLVSGALQLLFRHFSQRDEVLHAFQQVTTHSKY